MPMDYSDTGHLLVLGNKLSIAETIRRMWHYTRKINSSWPGSGNPYFKSVLNVALVNTSQDPDEVETLSKAAMADETEPGFQSIHEQWKRTVLDGISLPYIGKAMQLDEGSIQEGAITYQYDILETGQVSVSRRGGILGALKQQMEFDGESIRQNEVVLGAVTARPAAIGQLTENTVGGGRSHAFSGLITLFCVDERVGATKLHVNLVLDEPLIDGTRTIPCDNQVTVGADFEDGPTGLTLQMRYVALVETGDNGNVLSAADWDKPNNNDGDIGKLYLKLTRVHATGPLPMVWLWEWFNNANRETEALVGSREVDGVAGSAIVTIPGPNSNLSFTFDKAAADTHLPTVGNTDVDIVLDLKVPRLGAEFTKTVVNDETGIYATMLGKVYRATLAAVANPGQTIPDTLAPKFAIAAL